MNFAKRKNVPNLNIPSQAGSFSPSMGSPVDTSSKYGATDLPDWSSVIEENPNIRAFLAENHLLTPSLANRDHNHFNGLSNFGNTCYANSVIQMLYSCEPFRSALERDDSLLIPPAPSPDAASVPEALKNLFQEMSSQGVNCNLIQPRHFMAQVKKNLIQFRSAAQQDAHEFLNTILNLLSDTAARMPISPHDDDFNLSLYHEGSTSLQNSTEQSSTSWVDVLFSGVLTNEIICIHCQNKTSREERFLDLSVDVAVNNTSIGSCLESFSEREHLRRQNKFFCDACCALQEADKCMKIKRLPNVLVLHLKRFKYIAEKNTYIKLFDRVAFPFELRVKNTSEDTRNPDRLYELRSFIVHVGPGSTFGHYISVVRSGPHWVIIDDNVVGILPESDVARYFGGLSNRGSAYILLYEAVDFDFDSFQAHVQKDLAQNSPGRTQSAQASSTAANGDASQTATQKDEPCDIRDGLHSAVPSNSGSTLGVPAESDPKSDGSPSASSHQGSSGPSAPKGANASAQSPALPRASKGSSLSGPSQMGVSSGNHATGNRKGWSLKKGIAPRNKASGTQDTSHRSSSFSLKKLWK